jgi:3-oxoacyl-[acyl-carrier protein] reductase
MINPQLKDKVVFITGANHGIGAATARAFAEQGAKVFITAYRPPVPYSAGDLEEALGLIRSGSPRVIISEFRIPTMAAKKIVDSLRQQGRTIPVLVTTSQSGKTADLLVEKLGRRVPEQVLSARGARSCRRSLPWCTRRRGYASSVGFAFDGAARCKVPVRTRINWPETV